MKDVIYVIGHRNPDTDSICSAISLAHLKNKESENETYIPARSGEINSETEFVLNYFNFDKPKLMTNGKNKKIVMVDHNEFSQSIDDIENAEIIEVIDHHKINFNFSSPITFHTEPVGCTATMIAERYLSRRMIDKKIAGILLAAILSDTVVFKSPTTTERDKKMAKKLAQIADINNLEAFGMEIKKAKASLKNMAIPQIINMDFKEYNFCNNKVGVSQVEVVDFSEADKLRNDLLSEMRKMKKEGNYDLIIVMLTNIIKECSELLVIGDTKKVETAFNKKVENNSIFLKGVVSRKKQIIPQIEKAYDGA